MQIHSKFYIGCTQTTMWTHKKKTITNEVTRPNQCIVPIDDLQCMHHLTSRGHYIHWHIATKYQYRCVMTRTGCVICIYGGDRGCTDSWWVAAALARSFVRAESMSVPGHRRNWSLLASVALCVWSTSTWYSLFVHESDTCPVYIQCIWYSYTLLCIDAPDVHYLHQSPFNIW